MSIDKWIWLLSTSGVGARKAMKLYDYFDNDINVVYENDSLEEYMRVPGIDKNIAYNLIKNKNLNKFNKLIDYMYETNIKYITIDDKEYPGLLSEIYDCPPVLFYKGKNLFLEDNPMISMVGTRMPSAYGVNVATKFAREFSENGIDVVSGMAKGIDTCVHNGALMGRGDTIAVLGCGVDVVYPKVNQNLYDEIINERGMVISEYLPGTAPRSNFFPARNRIISGLSIGSIVIEATYRSGSLITARNANEQGREVYAVPGNITSTLCEGSNALLKDGAKIALSSKDVMEDLYYILRRKNFKPVKEVLLSKDFSNKEISQKRDSIKIQENTKFKNKDSGNEIKEQCFSIDEKKEKIDIMYKLSDEERRIVFSIIEGENSVDRLNEKLGIEINVLNSILTMLEIRGIVISTGTKLEIK